MIAALKRRWKNDGTSNSVWLPSCSKQGVRHGGRQRKVAGAAFGGVGVRGGASAGLGRRRREVDPERGGRGAAGCVGIVDLWHAQEHLWEVARELYREDPDLCRARACKWRAVLAPAAPSRWWRNCGGRFAPGLELMIGADHCWKDDRVGTMRGLLAAMLDIGSPSEIRGLELATD